MRKQNLWFAFIIVLGFASLSFIGFEQKNEEETKTSPPLIVVLSIDQMRYDFFERFGDLFQHGLRDLWQKGTIYTNAYHYHAPTNTAPGHATIATGSYPRRHGIISNTFYDPSTKRSKYCVEDALVQIVGIQQSGNLPGKSPRNLQVNTIGDWLKIKNSSSKVYSVSKKDRSAILLGGKKADGAFWFDEVTTRFVSSNYYPPYPNWARKFVGNVVMQDELEEGWTKIGPETYYTRSREDDFAQEAGIFSPTFPHTKTRMMPGIPAGRKNGFMLTATPLADDKILRFSKLLVQKEKLGADKYTDMLMIGCSAADAIGHHFGPYSQEVQDYYLRLDKYLGTFFDFLNKKIGENAYWVVLTSDHGVIPMPEESVRRGIDAKRISPNLVQTELKSIENKIKIELSLSKSLFNPTDRGIYLDYTETDTKGLSQKEVRSIIAKNITTLDFVADVYTIDDLTDTSVSKPYINYYRNSYISNSSPDILYRLKKNYLVYRANGTTHASPYDYDAHVPIVFFGSPFKAQKLDREVYTVDIAPTLSELLDLKESNDIDGQSLNEVTKIALENY